MDITIYSILNWLTGAVLVATAFAIYFMSDKSLAARLCSILSFVTGIWSLLVALSVSTKDLELGLILMKSCHFLGTMIATIFLLFALSYPNKKKLDTKITSLVIFVEMIFIYLFFFTNTIIDSALIMPNLPYFTWTYGSLRWLFNLYFIFCWIVGIWAITKKLKNANDLQLIKNLRLMLIAFVVSIIPPTILTIFLPQIGIFDYYWLSPLSCLFWTIVISYSITRHHLFNIKLVAAQLITFVLWVFILIRILLSTNTQEIIIESILLLITIISGIFLVKAVLREMKQREQLNDLNRNLEARVAAQTVEVRKAYEAEKHARLELEKLNDAKDQFIMITQHHLRTPTVSMLWALESTLKGAYGRLDEGVRTVLEDTEASGKRLMRIVDDFLNITAIKIGTNILDVKPSSLKPAVDDILAELKDTIAKMRLSVAYPVDDKDWPVLKIDHGKMRESLFIVFENAVRYNRDGGSITVTTATRGRNFEIAIENTGLGISEEESKKIGSALFYRGEYARKAYPIGMGVGLSVVKAIIRAHHGTFSIESRGKGEGARVTVRLLL